MNANKKAAALALMNKIKGPKINRELAEGANGLTFLTANTPPKVLKITAGNATREINVLRKLVAAGANFVPRPNFVNIRKNNLKKTLFPNNKEENVTVYTMNKVGNVSLWSHRPPNNNNRRRIRAEILRVIKFMHAHGISHGDLHADNILVELTADGRMKKLWVIDFGRYVNIPVGQSEKNAYEKLQKGGVYRNVPVLNMRAPDPAVQMWMGPGGRARKNMNMYEQTYR
jgi:RIO-like serine/threonine protein kinase